MTVPESARGTGRWLRVVTFAIGVGVVAHAQTQQPPEQPAASEPAASEPVDAESQPVFRAGITLVTTDVIVRDEDGVFIADLAAEEFIVREDGVVQEVVSLVLRSRGPGVQPAGPPASCARRHHPSADPSVERHGWADYHPVRRQPASAGEHDAKGQGGVPDDHRHLDSPR